MATADPDARSFTPINPWAMLRSWVNNNIVFIPISGAPTNGTSGTLAGQAGKGSQVVDITTGNIYSNSGTLASPTWVIVDSPASPLIQTASVVLTNSQIKAIRATPITLVAAPGAGFFVNPISCIIELLYGGTNAFTANAGDNLALKWKDGTTTAILTGGLQAFLQGTASAYNNFLPAAIGSDFNIAAANVTNQPLVIHNIGAAEIAGNAANDNTIRVTLTYNIAVGA